MSDSAQQQYPEQKPEQPEGNENFLFSITQGQQARQDLASRITKLQQRVDYINDNMKIKGHPIVELLLQLSRDPDELSKLGECLKRVAVILPELDELKKRKAVLDIAAENPQWLASVFGDYTSFTDKIDDEVARLMEEYNNGSS